MMRLHALQTAVVFSVGLMGAQVGSAALAQQAGAVDWQLQGMPHAQEGVEHPKVSRALTLLRAQKPQEAYALLQEVLDQGVLNDTQVLLAKKLQVRAAALLGQDDTVIALSNSLLRSNELSELNLQFVQKSLLGALLRTQQHPAALDLTQRLLEREPQDLPLLNVQTRLYFVEEQYSRALRSAQLEYQLNERVAVNPPESTLRIWVESARKQNDALQLQRGMQLLVQHHPKAEHWSDLIYQVQESGGFALGGDVHFYRLLDAARAVQFPEEVLDASEVFMRKGFFADARGVLQRGALLPALAEEPWLAQWNDRQRQLTLLWPEPSAPAKTNAGVGGEPLSADALVDKAYNLVVSKQVAEGMALFKQAFSMGGLKSPSLAGLTYAEALYASGAMEQSQQEFSQLREDPNLKRLAQLWLLLISGQSTQAKRIP